jgi:hypothetical protein
MAPSRRKQSFFEHHAIGLVRPEADDMELAQGTGLSSPIVRFTL